MEPTGSWAAWEWRPGTKEDGAHHAAPAEIPSSAGLRKIQTLGPHLHRLLQVGEGQKLGRNKDSSCYLPFFM